MRKINSQNELNALVEGTKVQVKYGNYTLIGTVQTDPYGSIEDWEENGCTLDKIGEDGEFIRNGKVYLPSSVNVGDDFSIYFGTGEQDSNQMLVLD